MMKREMKCPKKVLSQLNLDVDSTATTPTIFRYDSRLHRPFVFHLIRRSHSTDIMCTIALDNEKESCDIVYEAECVSIKRDDVVDLMKTRILNTMSAVLGIAPVSTVENKMHVLIHGSVEVGRVVVDRMGKLVRLTAHPIYKWEEGSDNVDDENESSCLPSDAIMTEVLLRLSEDHVRTL